jgi:hypothetical protein
METRPRTRTRTRTRGELLNLHQEAGQVVELHHLRMMPLKRRSLRWTWAKDRGNRLGLVRIPMKSRGSLRNSKPIRSGKNALGRLGSKLGNPKRNQKETQKSQEEGETMALMKKLFEKEPQKSSAASRTPQKGASHSGRSTAPLRNLPQTKVEVRDWREMEKDHHRKMDETHAAATQGLCILEEMVQPKESDGPSEMEALHQGMEAMLREMAALKMQNAEILSLLRRKI